MKIYSAVINADIVNSTYFSPEITSKWLEGLITLLKANQDLKWALPPEIYRGDSFQGVLENAGQALKAAILARAYLRSKKYNQTETDIRVAIGIGGIEKLTDRPGTSDGEAFRLSGYLADRIKQQKAKIGIALPSPSQPLSAVMDVLETLVENWTAPQSEVITGLLNNETVSLIAERLKISQSAVSQRINASKWWAADHLIQTFPDHIHLYTHQL
ncbi:SatD family protein [Dyadobacter helix]|nr:SatD family protein [Dyadobacter sp. CECT 9275]